MFKKWQLLAACLFVRAGWCDTPSASKIEEIIRAGDAAWADERWLDARNDLTRALEWNRLSGELTPNRRDELSEQRDEADRRWTASLPTPAIESVSEAKPRRRRASRRITVAPISEAATVEEIMAKAEAARRAGQLESALRLFRIAAGRPGGEPAAVQAAEIESEIGAQPER